ncbi:uncharacterized protein [Tiliqua scincoides]|uniref:uncharacterized protein n=1 Tax=Tiliqua scincoides TaxID=71010 RepID=UPI0034627962
METLAFTEEVSAHSASRKPRNSWIILSIVASLVIFVLVLLSLLVACFLFHNKQLPKICWIHGKSPKAGSAQAADSRDLSMERLVTSEAPIIWEWHQNCSGSGSGSGSSLEILKSDMYFVYIYVARMEDLTTENFFTVQLVQLNSNLKPKIISRLKGINATRASVTLGRPFYLEKGITLHLDINAGLEHIDSDRTYWGLFKI